MAKVLLVYPNLSAIRRVVPSLAALAGYLKRDGHDVTLLDTTFYFQEADDFAYRIKMGLVQPSNIGSVYRRKDEGSVADGFRRTVQETAPDVIGITLLQDMFFPFKGCDLYDLCVKEGLIKDEIRSLETGGVYEAYLPFAEEYKRKLQYAFDHFYDLTIGSLCSVDLLDHLNTVAH